MFKSSYWKIICVFNFLDNSLLFQFGLSPYLHARYVHMFRTMFSKSSPAGGQYSLFSFASLKVTKNLLIEMRIDVYVNIQFSVF